MPIDRNPNRGSYLDTSLAFEDRLKTLEAEQGQMAVQMGKQEVTLGYIKDSIETGFNSINESLKPLTDKVTKIDETLDSHDNYIKSKKEEEVKIEVKHEKRRDLKYKIIWAVLAASAGGAGTWLWTDVLKPFLGK